MHNSIKKYIRPVCYESFQHQKTFPSGTYLFTDIELLSPEQQEIIGAICDQLLANPKQYKVLNHPYRSLRRFEILRTLYQQQINQFNVYHIDEIPERFPVFLRHANDHRGPRSPLLYNHTELALAIKQLATQETDLSRWIITEYCDITDKQGIITKYGAFYINGQTIPRHRFMSNNWVIKQLKDTPSHLRERIYAEERHYTKTNPHSEQIKHIFKIANIDYGRIDYGLRDNTIQVWEINTNPTIVELLDMDSSHPRYPMCSNFIDIFNERLVSLDCASATKPDVIPDTIAWLRQVEYYFRRRKYYAANPLTHYIYQLTATLVRKQAKRCVAKYI